MLGHCQYADRNIDAIMLMPNRTDLEHRWNSSDAGVLVFDGLFSQAGEVRAPVAVGCMVRVREPEPEPEPG